MSDTRDSWQLGVDALAALLGAPVWTLAQTEAVLAEHDHRGASTGRRAVVVDDRFALFEVLSSGGRSTVFAGIDLVDGSEVALKLVLPTPSFAAHRRELERERDILSRLRHEHVVELLGSGVCGSLPYLATRRMLGGPLHEWLAGEPSLDARLQVLIDACAGLEAAADLGLAHGDIKPPNLLVSADGRGRVCDWGSAATEHEPDSLPRETTSLFRPPDLTSSLTPTVAADLFSLGLCIAFAVRGDHRAPAEGERAEPRAWLACAITDLEPGWLVELVSRCLAADPGKRPSAGEVGRALLRGRASCYRPRTESNSRTSACS